VFFLLCVLSRWLYFKLVGFLCAEILRRNYIHEIFKFLIYKKKVVFFVFCFSRLDVLIHAAWPPLEADGLVPHRRRAVPQTGTERRCVVFLVFVLVSFFLFSF
jgi:hypothetical protein